MASNVERRTLDDARLEARAVGEDQPSPKIVGYAAVFNTFTTLYQSPTLVVRERILSGAFRNAIAEGQDVRALVDHDSSLILGRTRSGTLTLSEDAQGLYFEITPPDTQVARDVMENIRVANVSNCSFAFLPRSGGETVVTTTENGVTTQSIDVTDVDLYDISVVTYPAYSETSCSVRAKQAQDGIKAKFLASRRAKIALLEIAAK